MDLNADISAFGSDVLVVHDHGGYVNVYGFDKETRHQNASTIDCNFIQKPCHVYSHDHHDQPGFRIDSTPNILSGPCNAVYVAL